MPTAGDTRLLVNPTTGLNIQNPSPDNGATDVDFDLAEVYGHIKIQEWLETPWPDWWAVPSSQAITNIGALSIAMSGGISMNTPTGEVWDAPNVSTATITSTSAETFAGETEYTWNFDSITLTHGTVTFGSVTRTYSTDSVTFTTGVSAPVLEHPTENGTDYYLNKDWLLEMRWTDGAETDATNYTVYFAATGDPEFIPRTDRSRYSITALKMYLDITLDYETEYQWFVRKDLGGGEYIDSDIWAFTTIAYAPPEYSIRTRPPYGGGDDIEVPTGENNMITVERLIAIANNKFFYEDV